MIGTAPKEIIYIKHEAQVDEAVAHLLGQRVLGFDTETWHSRNKRLPAFDPIEGARMRLSQWSTVGGKSFVFDHFYISKYYLYRMFPNPMLIVGQNIKFDLKFLMYELLIDEFGDIFDTMIAAQNISKGRVSGEDRMGFGLDDIALRELGLELPKDEQKSDWWRPELSEKQIQYAGMDSFVVLPIWDKQIARMKDMGLVRTNEIDCGAIPAVADIELNGMRLHEEKWRAAYSNKKIQIEDTNLRLQEKFGSQGTLFESIKSINLASGPEVMAAFKRLSLPLPIDPKTGRPSVDIKLLKPYENDYPLIADYRAYRKAVKLLEAFGPNWVDKCGMDGRIHANYKIIGAETGRMSCSGPNLQQVPQEGGYRNSFVAAPGWVIVGYDYSQCELRILAEYCLDPNLLRAFDEKYDLHRYTASLIFQCAMEEVTGKQRSIAKNLNFGIVYGIGVAKFAQDAGISRAEAEKIMQFYLRQTYPFMSKWLDRQGQSVFAHMTAYTMSGRQRTYIGDLADQEVKARIQRNAKNFPIQGTNGDITKRALRLVFEMIRPYRKGIKLIHVVHDEIICECLPGYVETCKWILQECMLKAEREYLKRVESVVDGSVTLCWTKEATDDQLAEAQQLIQESLGYAYA